MDLNRLMEEANELDKKGDYKAASLIDEAIVKLASLGDAGYSDTGEGGEDYPDAKEDSADKWSEGYSYTGEGFDEAYEDVDMIRGALAATQYIAKQIRKYQDTKKDKQPLELVAQMVEDYARKLDSRIISPTSYKLYRGMGLNTDRPEMDDFQDPPETM